MEKSKKSRTYYSPEFKADALSHLENVGLARACEDLGVSSSNLTRWKREARKAADPRSQPNSKDAPSYSDLEKEVRKLRREVGYLEQINSVLKKSTAIFSKGHLDGFK